MGLTEFQTLESPKLFIDTDMSAGEIMSSAGGMVGIYSARSPDKQTANEDSAALIPFDSHSGVLVVADGLGGGPSGQQASRLAVNALNNALKQAQRARLNMREAILNGIENASRSVNALGTGAATTLAVVEIQDRAIRPYHVGDSKILVMGQRGKIKLQTLSHAPVDYAVEAGFLDAGAAMHHAERHVVSNVIGSPEMRIEIGSSITLARYDTLLMASDGLFDNLHIEEIIARARRRLGQGRLRSHTSLPYAYA
jgi:PPM family protein phosphatase